MVRGTYEASIAYRASTLTILRFMAPIAIEIIFTPDALSRAKNALKNQGLQ